LAKKLTVSIKQPENEADSSNPSSAEVKNTWSYTSIPLRLHGVCLTKPRDHFTFTLYNLKVH